MSQDYSDDVFGTTQQVQANMQQIEDNFAALKSAFSGAAAPSDPVEGMWWLDTTTHLLKMRNEANSAWLSVWDMANNKPVVANLSNEITGAMIAASAKDPAAGTAGLRTLGTGASQACAGNDARLSDTRTPGDASVSQAKLKTSTGSVAAVDGSGHYNPAGGEYAFYPKFSVAAGDIHAWTANAQFINGMSSTGNLSAAAYVFLSIVSAGGSGYGLYCVTTYVTSSGEVFWIQLLRDRRSAALVGAYASPDHPCMGHGGKPLVMPHPFGDFDSSKHEIIVVNPNESELRELADKAVSTAEDRPDRSILQVILEEYEIDEKGGSPDWPKKPVTVGLPPGVDWKRMPEGSLLTPIKKVIPDMGFTRRTLRLK